MRHIDPRTLTEPGQRTLTSPGTSSVLGRRCLAWLLASALGATACGVGTLETEGWSNDQLGHPEAARQAFTVGRPEAIYLNRNGGRFTAGLDDATANVSSVIYWLKGAGCSAELPPYRPEQGEWAAVMSCVKKAFAPYAVGVVEEAPAPGTPHIEAVVTGGAAALVGESRYSANWVSGLAPSTLRPMKTGVVFAFGEYVGLATLHGRARAKRLCQVLVHEVGHALGLSHAMACSSVMYPRTSRYCGTQVAFSDDDLECGEVSSSSLEVVLQTCPDRLPSRNEHQRLLDALGPALR